MSGKAQRFLREAELRFHAVRGEVDSTHAWLRYYRAVEDMEALQYFEGQLRIWEDHLREAEKHLRRLGGDPARVLLN